jgi:hypothetical protein
LLTEKQDDFMAEALAVLRTGLEISPWISEDDTGARHAGKNGYCTQIGNDWFVPIRLTQTPTRGCVFMGKM